MSDIEHGSLLISSIVYFCHRGNKETAICLSASFLVNTFRFVQNEILLLTCCSSLFLDRCLILISHIASFILNRNTIPSLDTLDFE